MLLLVEGFEIPDGHGLLAARSSAGEEIPPDLLDEARGVPAVAAVELGDLGPVRVEADPAIGRDLWLLGERTEEVDQHGWDIRRDVGPRLPLRL